MRIADKLRIYLLEPAVAASLLSIMANVFGVQNIADFMHAESHDLLSLLTVLLGASLALWVGLFWISGTPFGQWLTEKDALAQINLGYIITILVLLASGLSTLVSAYVSTDHRTTHIICACACLWGLLTVPSTLNNTYKLLKLHGAFGRQRDKVAEIRQTNTR